MPVTYSSDYRDPPTGCGTIETESGELILIQDKGCNPKVKDGIYSKIIKIPYDFSEEYKKAQASLIKILRRYNVTQVYDSELCYGFMTINVFNKLRS
tara:strand:- start:140 stop:430 length:291 start_codon:yes stop_codon:yes gene_type:complete